MSETCTFCPAARYSALWVKKDPTREAKEIPICADCLTKVEQ